MDSPIEIIKERAALLSQKIGVEIPIYPVAEEARQMPVNLAAYIDHTNLACDATPAEIARLCEEAKQHHFAAVCVNGCYARQIRQALEGSGVKTCCVIGFPLGSMTVAAKISETRELVQLGIEEIDMVINCGWLKAGMYREVYDDIKAIVDVCHYGSKPTVLKVILECTCLETEELIIDASLLSLAAGADFIKTSTGMHKAGGARVRDVKIMRLVAGKKMQVKAAGGIRDSTTAKEMILAGADRIGASASISICAP